MWGFNELAVISEHPAAAAVSEFRWLSNGDFSHLEGMWPFLGQSALGRLWITLIWFVLMYINSESLIWMEP